MAKHRIFTTAFSSIYPLYVQKAANKNRTKEEVDEVICWLTGYDIQNLEKQIDENVDFETFLNQAPQINPNSTLIKGVVCGVRVEEIEDPLMQKVRYLMPTEQPRKFQPSHSFENNFPQKERNQTAVAKSS